MTTNDSFDRRLSSWLERDAVGRVPDHLDEVLLQTAATRQRPWWSSPERWLPMDLTARATTFPRPSFGRALVAALLLVALLAAALLIVGSRQRIPPPFGLARNGAVVSWQGGDILLADSEQAVARPIIGGATNDIAPLPSRDGTRLAFLRVLSEHSVNLMLANIDGTNIRQILDEPLTDMDWYEWSAKDDRLAIVSSVEGNRTLSIVDVQHRTSTPVKTNGLRVANDVWWVPPTGDALVFTATPHRTEDTSFAIYTVKADGTAITQIAPPRDEQASYLDVNVSSDGRTVSYWNYERDETGHEASRIHLRDIASGQDKVVKFDPSSDGETGLQFSPDGRHVVLQREAASKAQLMIAALDGSNPNLLVGPHFSVDEDAAYGFSPDGTKLLLLFNGHKPAYFDVATGTETTGPETMQNWGGYQRLAP